MKKTMFRAVCAAALLIGAPAAFAQSLVIPNQSGVINGAGQTFVINYTPGADSGSVNFVLQAMPSANVTFTAVAGAVPNGTNVCSVNMMNNTVSCNITAPDPNVDLGAGAITVTYTGGATVGAVMLQFQPSPATQFFNQLGVDEGGTATGGTLTLNAGPSGPTLAYNPTPTTAIAVPASISGTAVTSTIAVTQTGGDTGQTTTLACTAPTGYAATVTGSPFAPGGTGGSIGLACSGGAAAGNLTCVETRSGAGGGAPINHTWPLTCNAAPGFNSTPADGGTLSIVGIQGSVTPGSVAVSNPGTAALTISGCAVTGAGFTLGTVSASVASGGTGSIGVTCAVPAVAGTTITGTLQCNTNAAAPADVINYNLSCLSQSASIPTLGLGGKALMVLLMLGFGLVGFQLYRRSA
jgi:hypothetical protein